MLGRLFIVFVLCVSIINFCNGAKHQRGHNRSYRPKPPQSSKRTFEVDYKTSQFLKNGKPFRYVSGSIHYFRMPSIYWEDRLKKARAAGLNAIQTYVEWSFHEPEEGKYNFKGDRDLVRFINLAQKIGLLVILRAGPYICAERDLGGYPYWLGSKYPQMKLRSSDKNHMFFVKRWLEVLLPKIKPLLYGNGGPIIMVQVENEYDSYTSQDHKYTNWLRDFFKKYVENNAVLFTTDGTGRNRQKIPGVFMTIDFGPTTNKETLKKYFSSMARSGQKTGPLVNSEFYDGWLTQWNGKYHTVSTKSAVNGLKAILDYSNNTSVNMYMFYGGTNFGFTSGANFDNNEGGYRPQVTSYDYDAAITEAGDLTKKYYAIKALLKQYKFLKQPRIHVLSPKKESYGKVKLSPKMSIFEFIKNVKPVKSKHPKSFEELHQPNGFMLYKTVLGGDIGKTNHLFVPGLRDRANVLVDKVPSGVISRVSNNFNISINASSKQMLNLLVENQGHMNYGYRMDDDKIKGIVCPVFLNNKELVNWEMVKIPLNDISRVEKFKKGKGSSFSLPGFYSGTFQLPKKHKRGYDTFLNLSGWSKGVAFLNGFNLGRYWVTAGSQITLYVPGNLLKTFPHKNTLTILELEKENKSRTAVFQTVPILNGKVHVPPKFKGEIKCKRFDNIEIPNGVKQFKKKTKPY